MEKEKKRGRFMDDDLKVPLLPPEIITEILSRLPANSAIGCMGICKQWRSLVDHPSFRDTHTRQVILSSPSNPKKFGNYLIPNSSASSSGFFMYAKLDQDTSRYQLEVMEYNDGGSGDEKSVLTFKPTTPFGGFIHGNWGELNMISSCNGLVFMGSTNDMFICNPFTREYVNIPTAPTLEVTGEKRLARSRWWRWWGYRAYGFGYHSCTNEYKVVSISYDGSITSKGKVSVYTLGTGKWRNKGEIPYLVCRSSNSCPSLFANGAIHWLTSTGKQIVSFDLADEEFRVVFPLLRPPSLDYADRYGVLGGCLCVTAKCESSIDIWVLDVRITNNNKEEFSWNKKFSMPWKGSTYFTPQVVTKNGKIVSCESCDSFVDDNFGCTLVSYDLKSEALVYGNMFSRSWGKLITYTKSFVSLKALGEEDVRHWGSKSVAHADETPCRAAAVAVKKSWPDL